MCIFAAFQPAGSAYSGHSKIRYQRLPLAKSGGAARRPSRKYRCRSGFKTSDQVELIGTLGYFQTLTRPRDIKVFIGLWNGKGPVRFDATEISRILEIPLKTLVGIHQAERYHECQPDIKELEYPFEDVVIWGATAKILHRFIELIYPLLSD
jgi:hypothetical protein